MELIGKDVLNHLRREVYKRRDLRMSIKSLSLEKFDLAKAAKAYSSCLTRCIIEQEFNREPRLEALRILVFEKMKELFDGKRLVPLRFLQGVFLNCKE